MRCGPGREVRGGAGFGPAPVRPGGDLAGEGRALSGQALMAAGSADVVAKAATVYAPPG